MQTRILVPKPKTTVIGLHGSKTSAHVKITSLVWLTQSLPVVVAKAYAIGRMLHLAAYL